MPAVKKQGTAETWVESESRDKWRLRRGAQLTARGPLHIGTTVCRAPFVCSALNLCLPALFDTAVRILP
jgi:hypothetical protein